MFEHLFVSLLYLLVPLQHTITFYFFSLLAEKFFLSDTTMHLFLQTNLSIKEIKNYIEGKISAYSLDSLWKANGVKENCRYVNFI